MGKEYRTVKLEVKLIAELDKLKHPGQSLNGVIQELLEGEGAGEMSKDDICTCGHNVQDHQVGYYTECLVKNCPCCGFDVTEDEGEDGG